MLFEFAIELVSVLVAFVAGYLFGLARGEDATAAKVGSIVNHAIAVRESSLGGVASALELPGMTRLRASLRSEGLMG